MADYFVASGGSNTAPYDTWAKASTSLQTALTAATTNGDRVIVQYNAVPTGDAEVTVDTTYTLTLAAYIQILSASNDGGSAFTLTAMGAANWIGNSTTFRSISFAGADSRVYLFGLTLRTAGATLDTITLASNVGGSYEFDGGYIWAGNTGSGVVIGSGNNSGGLNRVRVKNTTIRFGSVNGSISCYGIAEFDNCTISTAGSAPTVLLTDRLGGRYRFTGCDLSFVTGTLVGNITNTTTATFDRCKLGSGVSILASQTSNPTLSSAEAFVFDCASGDTHGLFGYYNALGSVVSDTGIYYTSGAAGQSWKIVTTANASFLCPFETPWIPFYHSGTSAVTPYVEILRDGSATAYQDNQIGLQVTAKTMTTSTVASFYSDYLAATGTAANQAAGAGLGSWTGEGGTAWSGKIDSGSAITPAEVGDMAARIVVGAPSITVYVDPQVRT